jgi:hypothetical protein
MSMLSLLVLRQLRPLTGPSTEQTPRRVDDEASSNDAETDERDRPAHPMDKTVASIHRNKPSRERSPS